MLRAGEERGFGVLCVRKKGTSSPVNRDPLLVITKKKIGMKMNALKKDLASHKDWNVKFVLPSGKSAPAHAHVTEVARIDKKDVDCGGTFRTDSFCLSRRGWQRI